MNVKLSILALALFGGMAAAVTPVWSITDGNGPDIHPYGKNWYPFVSIKDSTVSADTATLSNARALILSVSKTKESSAGVTFAWAKDDGIKDLSAYAGVCLTYTASAPFRLDFKQSNITDYNYNGVIVPAQSSFNTVYFPFSEFEQENWGDDTNVKKFDLTKQTGVQFVYKKSLAVESGKTGNTIKVSAIAFGSSCENHAPSLKTGVKANDADNLLEGDVYEVVLKDIFEDEDGDELNITLAKDDSIVEIDAMRSYPLSGTVKLKSVPNPKTGSTSTITFTAKDGAGLSATYKLVLTLEDRKNAPVAVDDSYTVDEDSKLTVSSAKGVLRNDYDDDDGDNSGLTATLDETTSHGVLDFKGSGFTYTPNPDFYGEDTFTYHVTDGDLLDSEPATVTITVKNVEDPATLTINQPFFYVGSLDEDAINFEDGVKVPEDFEDFDIFIPLENLEFSDPDVLTPNFPLQVASAKGVVNVAYTKVSGNHAISVSAVPNANGKDVIKLFTIDGKDTVGIDIPIEVEKVADKPVAVADAYDMAQDTVNAVSAKLGVLANDFNPDGESVLKAYLFEDADEGKVKLATDGSFTYEVGDFDGEDVFTYFVVNAEGDTSEVVAVTLTVKYRNRGPQVLAGVADTAGNRVAGLKEDFNGSIMFKGVEVKNWFEDPEGDEITLNAVNSDSLLNVTINTLGAITIKSVKNACGETTLDVIATDTQKNSTTLSIPVSITCVNDAPMRIGGAIDTVLEPPSGWREAFYVFDVFEDPDDSVLTMSVSTPDKEKVVNAVVEGDSLIFQLFDEQRYLQNFVPYTVKVTATDEAGEKAIAKTFIFMVGEKAGIQQVATATKLGWQGAIGAERGMAAIFDMQGRVMWKHALPVSEAQVRNAAAKVQGRKILMVNKQTWTIK